MSIEDQGLASMFIQGDSEQKKAKREERVNQPPPPFKTPAITPQQPQIDKTPTIQLPPPTQEDISQQPQQPHIQVMNIELGHHHVELNCNTIPLGITFDTSNKQTLRIMTIADNSIIHEWNKFVDTATIVREHYVVQVGDHITHVNGLSTVHTQIPYTILRT